MPIAIMGSLGLILIGIREGKTGKVFIVFPIILYLVLVFKSQYFSRYVLPIVPFIAVGAGYPHLRSVYSGPKVLPLPWEEFPEDSGNVEPGVLRARHEREQIVW